MLIRQPQVEIASKIVRTPSGELVRAYFALVTIEGKTEVRFLGAKPVGAEIAAPAPILCLPGMVAASFGESIIRRFESVLSPFYSLESILTSQPARAPNLA